MLSFTLPLLLGYQFNRMIEGMRYTDQQVELNLTLHLDPVDDKLVAVADTNILTDIVGLVIGFGRGGTYDAGTLGLLFSPGAGLFFYVPILLTVFFSFPDFFRKNKIFTILLLVIPSIFIIDFGSFTAWQGFTAWSPKYLYAIIPFLLLPLGASIEKRGRKILVIIGVLCCVGLFFNFTYVVQDVSWFVWGQPGGFEGLVSLAQGRSCSLYICPEVTWTFQYSPLTASINTALNNLHPDLFLLKLFGIQYYLLTLVSVLSAEFYLLYRISKSKIMSSHSIQENN
jgi:hypothetical protein